jgi:hypothetical protein
LYLSIALSITTLIIAFVVLKNKRKRYRMKKADEKLLKKLKTGLILMSEETAKAEIKKAYALKNLQNTDKNEKDLFNKEIHCKFTFNEITKTDVADVYKGAFNIDNIALFVTECSNEVLEFAKKLKIELYTVKDLFEVFKAVNYYPEIKIEISEKSPTLKDTFKNLFLYKHGKNFFIAGFMLMILSFFTPFKIYYLIVGGLFLITSVICRFYGKKETEHHNT